VKDYSPIPC